MENGKDTALFDLRNQIYCTDCMGLMAYIPDNFVSLILTDRPMASLIKTILPDSPISNWTGTAG